MRLHRRFLISLALSTTLLLSGCNGVSVAYLLSRTGIWHPKPEPQTFVATASPAPTKVITMQVEPTAALAPTSIFRDAYAYSDQFGDEFIPRLPIEDGIDLPPDEIVRLLVDQWLEHYQKDCSDPYYRLETYSVREIRLDTASKGYEIVANVQYEILPAQPLLAGYTGETAPNGWVAFPGTFLPDGTEQLGAYFGVYSEGEFFLLRMLIGWGV